VRAASERERRLWRAAFGLAGAIYASAYFVQFALDFLRAHNLLRLTIGVVFALVAGAVIATMARAGAGARAWSTLLLVGAAYAAAALLLEIVQERIHLIEYGALALAARGALTARAAADPTSGFRSPEAASCGALAFGFVVGVGDELLQGALPNRVGELRDVGINSLSAALAVAAAAAVERALQRDRRARAAPEPAA
jgi:hypothetical protein